ncbi:hypothetical protein C2I06_04185 [Niallia circulans]|nr:hypothetical protein C2I06_04185 [Niallia circulans]
MISNRYNKAEERIKALLKKMGEFFYFHTICRITIETKSIKSDSFKLKSLSLMLMGDFCCIHEITA